jgi:hypothetical protein
MTGSPIAIDTPPAHRPSWLPGWAVPVLGTVGLALLVYLIVDLGPDRIATQLRGLGAILPVVLALIGVKYLLQTAGWRLVLPREARPAWPESISATITGDALGYLTWAGPFTGEPIRAVLIRRSVPLGAGVAAGAIERTVYHLTAGALVAGVATALLWTTSPLLRVLVGILAVVMVGIVLRRRAGRRAMDHGAPLATIATGAAAGKQRAFVQAASALWHERPAALGVLVVLCLLQHAILVPQAFLMLQALGVSPTVGTALIFEALAKVVNTAGVFVPGRLGISEGGSALLADALGFAASHGLSLALMRRVRSLSWAVVGLALLPLQEAQARRAGRLAVPQRPPS